MRQIKLLSSLLLSALLITLTSSVVLAQEARIWTDQEIYSEGDYVKVNIQLPQEKFSSCETHLIDPTGYEFSTGEGGCAAGITEFFDERYMTQAEDRYTPSGELEEFASSVIIDGVEYGRLADKFGNWGMKVLVKKDGQVWQTLNTNFEYKYYNYIMSFCKLENEKTKTCEFLGSPFTITKGDGCGPNPVEITVSYFDGTYTFHIEQGDKAELTTGSITVRNMGSPCSADVLNLRFDKAIPPEETSLKVSVENMEIEVTMEGETKTYSLPTEEKTQVIEARVGEEDELKKMSVDIDKTKNILVVESNDISAETTLPLILEGSKLYVDSNGEKAEVKILPDSALEKVKDEVTSSQSTSPAQKIEIQGGNAIYSIKGSKDAKILGFIQTKLDVEAEVDAKTGQVNKLEKPWWSFLAW